MKTEIIQSLTNDFESYARETENGVEFWLARDLQHLLGYEQWKNFKTVIDKARTACEMAEHRISNHFADVGKTIKMPKGAEKTIVGIPDVKAWTTAETADWEMEGKSLKGYRKSRIKSWTAQKKS